ncbi:MAG TPA: carboxypeptidase-like regulatory domain-containing protein [Candidatus Acidoferrales bacterium]|nr:carboxypeptidase-like regulatory domain-containing protein [Candidatus Acidoferrales bacterium]
MASHPALGRGVLAWVGLALLPFGVPAPAQSQILPAAHQAATLQSNPPPPSAQADGQAATPQLPGTISGVIVDQTGAAVVGARISLSNENHSSTQEVLSGDDGQFSFAAISPGSFELTVTSAGFAPATYSGVLHPEEILTVPPITLPVAANVTRVTVGLPPAELAEIQVKEEEKQRVLGFLPDFYVTYVPDAAPLRPKQKFELAWKTTLDPVTFGLTAAVAGIEQGVNQYSGYGGGMQGYGKRYGAAYANSLAGSYIGDAILPSLLKQDPRYFYKGTGSKRSRLLYAIANSVICKGDNGRWQPNYSHILGDFAAGGISNLYYPAKDRKGAGLTLENGAIGIGATAAADVLQEFVIRKFTRIKS